MLESKFGQGLLPARGPRAQRGPAAASVAQRPRFRPASRRAWQSTTLPLKSQTQLGQLHEGSLGALPLPPGPCKWSRARFLPRALVFVAASIQAAGQCFSWPCHGFPLPAIKKRGGRSFSLGRLSEQFRDRNALANANAKSSPSRCGCFMKRFSAGVVS